MPTVVKYTSDDLDNHAYREIQAIAKAKGIASNQKKSSLIKAIIESQNSSLLIDFIEEEVDAKDVKNEEVSSEEVVEGDEIEKAVDEEKEVRTEEVKEGEESGGHEQIEFSIIRTGIEASECLTSPDFNMKKSLNPMRSSSSSSSIEEKWKQSYVSSPLQDQTFNSMHDITHNENVEYKDNTEISSATTASAAISNASSLAVTPKSSKKKHIAVTPTPVKFDDTMNTIHEYENPIVDSNVPSVSFSSPLAPEANEQVQIVTGSPVDQHQQKVDQESFTIGGMKKLNGIPTPAGKKTSFLSPMTKSSEQYNVFWSYEEYNKRCEITTPQSLKMMQDNITTPQFLENQRKERAENERAEMLSQVTKAAEDLFDDLIPPLKENESILPSFIVSADNSTTSTTENSLNDPNIEDKENCIQQAQNLLNSVNGFISKVNSNIKNLVGLPTPQGNKITFFSPESKPFAINWNSADKSKTENLLKDTTLSNSDYSSSV